MVVEIALSDVLNNIHANLQVQDQKSEKVCPSVSGAENVFFRVAYTGSIDSTQASFNSGCCFFFQQYLIQPAYLNRNGAFSSSSSESSLFREHFLRHRFRIESTLYVGFRQL